MQVDYHAKYLKYKQKYLDLKEEMMGSGGPAIGKPEPIHEMWGPKEKEAFVKKMTPEQLKKAGMCIGKPEDTGMTAAEVRKILDKGPDKEKKGVISCLYDNPIPI